MRLDRLIDGLETWTAARGDPAQVEVTSVEFDSRAVAAGAIYCCVRGAHVDGHDFAPAAVGAGAVALLSEREIDVPVAQIIVPDTRRAMARVAAAFWGQPSDRLAVVGVTGTNGKTTTTQLLATILEGHGWPTGVLGTLSGARTTPEAPELQARLAAFVAEGERAVAMEVSSHALVQGRADAIRFAAAVFTNLSQDHLDYHGTMEEYFRAKAVLFEPGRARLAVINRDDEWGRRLLESVDGALSYSLDDAEGLVTDHRSSTFEWRGQIVRLPLGGRFNVANALAAATTAVALGVDPAQAAAALSHVPPVPGRYEAVDAGQDFTLLVDYAHTPAALAEVLDAARTGLRPGGRVVVVFGCGGDRDALKRPLMGEVATRMADLTFLTSDNPRSEDPLAIIDQVRAGVSGDRLDRLVVEPDRRAAIGLAVDAARPGDVVIIAGKGHETTQEIAGRVFPFDDRVEARRAIGERRPARGSAG